MVDQIFIFFVVHKALDSVTDDLSFGDGNFMPTTASGSAAILTFWVLITLKQISNAIPCGNERCWSGANRVRRDCGRSRAERDGKGDGGKDGPSPTGHL